MNRQAGRALSSLTAALLSVGAAVFVAAPALADPATYYVSTSGSDADTCDSVDHACLTIGHALSLAADGDTVSVADGDYAEDVVVSKSVTMLGNTASVAGTLTVNGPSDISNFTFAPTNTDPVVIVQDTVGTGAIAIHNNHFVGSGQQALLATGSSPNLRVNGNTFSGTTDAIALAAPDEADTLTATVNGNSGTVASGGHSIVRSGAGSISVSTTTPNTITTATGTSVSLSAPSVAVTTHEAPATFTATVSSAMALVSPRLDVSLVNPTGVAASDITLSYSTNGTTYSPIGSLPDGVGVPSGSSVTTWFRVAVADGAPSGSVGVRIRIVEQDGSTITNEAAKATLPVTVTANSPPVATDVPVSTPRNTPVAVTLTATDADRDPLTWNYPADPRLTGTAPNLTFTPAPASSAPFTFDYTATDGKAGTSNTATVTVTVGANHKPTATAPGAVGVPFQTPTNIALSGSDSDGDPLTYSISGVTHGTVDLTTGSLPADGVTAQFTPATGYSGDASFQYTVSDGTLSDTVTVSLIIGDGPPVASAPSQVAVAFKTQSADILLTASDPNNDPLTYTLTQPSSGSLNTNTLTGSLPDGGLTVRYTPTGRTSGTDFFTFKVSDGVRSSTAIIKLIVTADAAPTASGFTYSTVVPYLSSGVTIDLTGHAADADNDALTFVGAPTSAKGGTVSISSGVATYTPPATVDSTDGTDSFTFSVRDPDSKASGLVTVTLSRVDRKPVATDSPTLTVAHNNGSQQPPQSVVVPIASTDPDPGDTAALTYQAPNAAGDFGYPTHGSTSYDATTHTLTYKPGNYVGSDQVQYKVSDGHGGVDIGTATITVTDNAPTLTVPSKTLVDFNQPQVITPALADDDPGDVPLIKQTNPVSKNHLGTVVISADRKSVTYTPEPGESGADSFVLQSTDSYVTSTPPTVVHVVIDTPPVATAPSLKHVALGKTVQFTVTATDKDKDHLTYSVTKQPAHGKVTQIKDGLFSYKAPMDWAGSLSVPIKVGDGRNGFDTATVQLVVDKATTAITGMAVSPTRPTSAQHPTLTITVASRGTVGGGNVVVRTGSGTVTRAVNSVGKATISLPAYTGGRHTISATFAGTPTAAAVTRAVSKSFTVNRVASTIDKFSTNPTQLTSTTTNAVATVHIASVLTPDSGTVTITNNETGARLASGPVRNGVAKLRLPTLPLGQTNLLVTYGGTSKIAGSTKLVTERVPQGR